MKQRTIATVLALAAMALSTTPALAQDARDKNLGGLPVPVPAERIERIMDKKAEVKNRIASSTERKIDRQQDIAKRQAEHAAKIMTATVERLEKILARIESRIEKIKENGGNTSESERYVAEAKAHLEEAKKNIEAFSSLDLSADKAKENFSRVRSIASEVKVHLKAARESMMMAVRNLKPGRSNDSNSTSTSEQ